MHDTNYPWGYYNDTEYTGDFSEYPAHLNRSKKGLVEAINDFLSINPGWQIKEVRMNNYGLTILERVSKKAMKDNPDIHIFIHACTLANWKDVLNRQLSRIYDSGLYHAATSINIGVLGTESIDEFKLKYPKIKQLFQKPDVKLYERPTLYCLHETCVKNPGDSVVLYLHTKGITRTNPYVTDWTLLMEHFLIDNWQNCLEELKRADTCGLNYQPMPARHYSGNFWWANSNHISTLPAKIGPCYVDPETWIGLNNPNMKCIYQSNVDHYNLPYPESKYKTK